MFYRKGELLLLFDCGLKWFTDLAIIHVSLTELACLREKTEGSVLQVGTKESILTQEDDHY